MTIKVCLERSGRPTLRKGVAERSEHAPWSMKAVSAEFWTPRKIPEFMQRSAAGTAILSGVN